MKISRIHIKNFRSIKELTFEPGNICALVGENGAGKSNILAALYFLLGERWPSSRSLDPSDYFCHDESRTVSIGVQFEQNPSRVDWYWCKFQPDKKDEVRYTRVGEPNPIFVSNEMREKLALVHVDEHRDLDKHLRHSKWELMGRILHHFNSILPEDNKEQLEYHFQQALQSLGTDEFTAFKQELSLSFADQVRQVNKDLKIEFKTLDPLSYYKSINLSLLHDEQTQSLSEAGQGIRNLTIIALFRAYAKMFRGDAILAIEEPELYLHPHAERNLAKVFRDLASQGNQLFYTTHSSRFVDLEHFDEICLVERKEDAEGDLCTRLRYASADDLLEARKNLRPDKPITVEGLRERYQILYGLEHSEALFARKIVLVEGPSEAYALPIYAVALNYDFDAHGVSIVSANGKNNLDELYQLYHQFKIPLYVVFDSDRGSNDQDKLSCNELLLRMLGESEEPEPNGRVDATYAISDKDFEEEIRSSIGESLYNSLMSEASHQLGRVGKGIKARYVAKQLVEQDNIPEYICRIIEAIKRLASDPEEENGTVESS